MYYLGEFNLTKFHFLSHKMGIIIPTFRDWNTKPDDVCKSLDIVPGINTKQIVVDTIIVIVINIRKDLNAFF